MHYMHDHLANGCITLQFVIRELKQRRRRRQRERQKSNSKTATLHVHHAFFVHFFDVVARLQRVSA